MAEYEKNSHQVQIKTADEILRMRAASKICADMLIMIGDYIRPGVTTEDLNQICHDFIIARGGYPASLGYHGFPKSVCISVNNVVCHGIPGSKKLKKGDILNIDVVVVKDGYHGDTSKMFFVDKPTVLAERLVRITQEAMIIGIKMIKPGVQLGDIGYAIQQHVEKNHYSVVREYCGHGVGSVMHEPQLQVLHYGNPGTGITLEEGMTFTIEPMVNAGKRHIRLLPDQWTVVTKDRSLSAQWEHTLAVTPDGVEVLTYREGDEHWL
jgi:methionyl aminopeptidase